MNDVIVFDNVSKSFDSFHLKNLSFTVKKGYITGFIGANGSGKTSTMKLILNLLHKGSGTINVFGLDSVKHEKEIKQRIGFVHAENYFYEEWTVYQAKKVISSFYTNWDEAVYNQYMDSFQVPREKKIKELSTGTRMKFSLALALSHHADLLLLDEPTSGVDPVFRQELLDILAELVRDGEKAVFFSTHITTDLDQLADYILFIHRGEIVLSGEKETILSQYRVVRGPVQMLNSTTSDMFIGLRKTDNRFEGLTKEWSQLEQQSTETITVEVPSLEQMMVHIVKERN